MTFIHNLFPQAASRQRFCGTLCHEYYIYHVVLQQPAASALSAFDMDLNDTAPIVQDAMRWYATPNSNEPAPPEGPPANINPSDEDTEYEDEPQGDSSPPPLDHDGQFGRWVPRGRAKSKQSAPLQFKHVHFGSASTSQHSPDASSYTEHGKCPICPKILKLKSIKAHIDKVHYKKGRRECPHCKRTLSQPSALKRHIEENYCHAFSSSPESQNNASVDGEREMEGTP
ncbi:hypothetical protein OBBRIDRAFT_885606, partial [Obba rivulosa]